MKIPQISGLNLSRIVEHPQRQIFGKVYEPYFKMPTDRVNFTSSAKYLKKYATLPDEIKKIVNPKDAIDMFRDMEYVASGAIKRDSIGQGDASKVYKTPWLKDYYFIVLKNKTDNNIQTIYSKYNLGDSIWADKFDSRFQIIKAS